MILKENIADLLEVVHFPGNQSDIQLLIDLILSLLNSFESFNVGLAAEIP